MITGRMKRPVEELVMDVVMSSLGCNDENTKQHHQLDLTKATFLHRRESVGNRLQLIQGVHDEVVQVEVTNGRQGQH